VKSLDGHAKNTAGPSDCPEGNESVVISPGNYGLAFMKEHYGYDLNDAVKCSNYIGETLDMAVEAGFKRLLLAGHIGKLIKVSGGIMNTHSKEADCRMELMAAAAVQARANHDTLNGILNSVSTEEAYGFLVNAGIEKECMSHIMDKVMYHLNKRTGGRLDISCIIYSNKWGLLGCSAGDEELSGFFNS
jgi:cobalt-precorrin-5B (C1)-methyltransferase